MKLADVGFSPFIYFGQHLAVEEPTAVDRLFLRTAYGLWHLLDGGATFIADGLESRIHPGQAAVSRPSTAVQLGRRARLILIAFDLCDRPRSRQGRAWIMPAGPPQPPWRDLFGHELPSLVDASWQQLTASLVDHLAKDYWIDDAHRLEANAQLALWVLRYARHLAGIGDQRTVRDQRDQLSVRAEAYIRAHFAEPITVEDVARACGVSRAHLARSFRAAAQFNIGELLRDVRMTQAKMLLEHGDEPVGRVAVAVGYRSAGAFIGAFRRATGLTPRRYRQRMRA